MTILRISNRLQLRPVVEGDAEPIYALVEADREALAEWMPWAGSQTLEGTCAFVAEARAQEEREDGFQAAILLDDEVAGIVGYHGIDRVNRATSIGYWLASRHQGKGVMTTAARALVDHAFVELALHRLTIHAAVENRRSRAVAERLGFVEEAVMSDSQLVGGRYLDGVLYAMLAPDWPG